MLNNVKVFVRKSGNISFETSWSLSEVNYLN